VGLNSDSIGAIRLQCNKKSKKNDSSVRNEECDHAGTTGDWGNGTFKEEMNFSDSADVTFSSSVQ